MNTPARWAFFGLALASSCTGGPKGPVSSQVAIVYTNNVEGEIEPCG